MKNANVVVVKNTNTAASQKELYLRNLKILKVIAMNKKIILTGDACTGKSFTANMIATAYNNVVLLLAQKINKRKPFFIYDGVTEKNDLIIIDDVTPDKFPVFEDLILGESLIVHARSKNPFLVKVPDVIITFDGNHEFFKNYGV